MGYCPTLQNEKYLRSLEENLSQQLRKKGKFAKYTFRDIIHSSASIKKAIRIAKQSAATDYTVLLYGENGTGKELFAQAIHNYSSRSDHPFVAVNCAALPESLLESQLFGYEEGSFTGAQKGGKAGLSEQAHHGSIFLDEIGDISFNLQSQLLRVLQEKQIMRISSDKIIDTDVRIIAATNQNLNDLVDAGKFRKDLFFRLAVLPIHIPPLRERREDILPLLSHFLGENLSLVSKKDLDHLTTYDWLGNVRQLESAALYFKTLHTFPDFSVFFNEAVLPPGTNSRSDGTDSLPDLQIMVLQIIADFTEPFHGIGRSLLLMLLREKEVRLSDAKLRQILQALASQHFITISRGRSGCRITEAGHSFLQEHLTHPSEI